MAGPPMRTMRTGSDHSSDSSGARLTSTDVKALVASLKDIVATHADADPADKPAVYRELDIASVPL